MILFKREQLNIKYYENIIIKNKECKQTDIYCFIYNKIYALQKFC